MYICIIYATNIELIALIRLALKNGFVIYSRLWLSFRLSTPIPSTCACQASRPASQPFVLQLWLRYVSQISFTRSNNYPASFILVAEIAYKHTYKHTHMYMCQFVLAQIDEFEPRKAAHCANLRATAGVFSLIKCFA